MAKKTPVKIVKKSDKRTKGTSYFLIISALVLIVLLVYGAMNFSTIKKIILSESPEKKDVAAMVNNEEITLSELDLLYKLSVPEEYKMAVSKEQFLNESAIPQKLLLQEAEKKGIAVTDEELGASLNLLFAERSITKEEFEAQLKEKGLTLDQVMKSFKENLIINKLINQTILSNITVTEKEIKRFYSEHEELKNVSYDLVKERIKSQLLYTKQNSVFEVYLKQLKSSATITIYYSGNEIISFTKLDNEICRQDGKPIVRVFTTTNCDECKKVKSRVDSVLMEYAEGQKIAAYHWELDKGDNTLTPAVEKGVPKSEVELLKGYSPKGKVPLYVVGCRYARIGNYYGDDIGSEEKELRLVIEDILK